MALCGLRSQPPGSQSAGYSRPIPDGRVVLVTNGAEIGAFILTRQAVIQSGGRACGSMSYTWYLRKAGQGSLDPTNSSVHSGWVNHATNAVKFGTFNIPWSMCGQGSGWVYYTAFPVYPRGNPTQAMCVTLETNLVGLDALDQKWTYRARPPINLVELMGY
jgi:hypothetical protein